MTKARKISAVYRIRNIVSGKFYIGSSASLYERWRTHRKKLRAGTHPNRHLQASWAKHGEDAFKFELLAEYPPEELEIREEAILRFIVQHPACTNLSESAYAPWRGKYGEEHPNYGKTLSKEQKALQREITLRQWKHSDPRTGKKHSADTKAKISKKVQAALLGGRGGKFIPSKETRKKMSEALKGNQCAKGYKRTDAEKAAIAERMRGNQNWKGRNHTAESRKKMSHAVILKRPVGGDGAYSAELFDSITALRERTGMKPPTVNRALKSGKPIAKGPHKGVIIERVG